MGGRGSGARLDDADWEPAEGTDPWDRQPDETSFSWAGFVAYRDLGPWRTIPKATESLGKVPGYTQQMSEWSRKFHWVRRCALWDAHQDAVSREAILEAKRAEAASMVSRHTAISTNLQRLASVELARTLHALEADLENPDLTKGPAFTPKEIQSIFEMATKMERLNRNEPETITEARGKLSSDKLEERILQLLSLRGDG